MSHGPGAAQRAALAALAAVRAEPGPDRLRWVRAHQLAALRAGRPPVASEVAAMRRALRGLAERGLVEVSHWGQLAGGAWSRQGLLARLPLTDAEQARL